jgi:putative drug exporter of the RND superfamily
MAAATPGTIAAPLVPIALALVAVAAGLGGIMLLANALDVSTAAPTIGAMIGLGVGIDDALFIVARSRENRAAGQDNARALSDAMASSGSAVLFAGGIVVVAMAALVLTGLGFLASIALSTSLVVVFAMATALTLLSLLGTASRRAGSWAAGGPRGMPRTRSGGDRASCVGQAVAVPRRRHGGAARAGCAGTGDGDGPPGRRRRPDEHDTPSCPRPAGGGLRSRVQRPLWLLVADLRSPGVDAGSIPALSDLVAADPGIAQVGEARTSPAGDTVVLPTIPTTAPADAETSETLARVRDLVPANVAVSGLTAMTDDLTE